MNMISVPSSSIVARIGYDKEREVLCVDFHKTGMYEYYNVSEDEYKLLQANTSVGTAVHKFIKGRTFKKMEEK